MSAPITTEQIRLFKRYFTGLTNVYGTYNPSTGQACQIKQPVTDQVIHDHLTGKQSYGVYP